MSYEHTSISSNLQKNLVEYGLIRDKATKGTKDTKGDGAKFFGIRNGLDEDAELKFADDPTKLASGDAYRLALVVPNDNAFDMLATKSVLKPLNMASEKDVRKFLMNLINSV